MIQVGWRKIKSEEKKVVRDRNSINGFFVYWLVEIVLFKASVVRTLDLLVILFI
jgi:hypothetical protein